MDKLNLVIHWQFGTYFEMVVLSSSETSSLTFPPISDVVFVMDETAATALYLTAEMRDNYIVPTLEHFGELLLLHSSYRAGEHGFVIKILAHVVCIIQGLQYYTISYHNFYFPENGGEDKRQTPSWAQIRCSSTFTIILYRGPVCRLG